MEYRFNKERNRLANYTYDPHFIRAYFQDITTGDIRAMLLYTATSVKREWDGVAGNYTEANEEFIRTEAVSKKEFTLWFTGGQEFLSYGGEKIPAEHVLNFCLAKDLSKVEPFSDKCRKGNLALLRERLLTEDDNLLQEISISYEQSKPEHDVVREEKEPEFMEIPDYV